MKKSLFFLAICAAFLIINSCNDTESTIKTCPNACTADVCNGIRAYRMCEDFDTDGCKELSDSISCLEGETCHDGACTDKVSCKGTCFVDVCDGDDAYQVCEDRDGDGCRELSEPISCSEGEKCDKGKCVKPDA